MIKSMLTIFGTLIGVCYIYIGMKIEEPFLFLFSFAPFLVAINSLFGNKKEEEDE